MFCVSMENENPQIPMCELEWGQLLSLGHVNLLMNVLDQSKRVWMSSEEENVT